MNCTQCRKLVSFDESAALVLCAGCDEKCGVCELRGRLEPQGLSVTVELCWRPLNQRKQRYAKKLDLLHYYLDRQAGMLKSRIKSVAHEMVSNIAGCCAEVIRDHDCLFAAAPNNAEYE